MHRFFYVVALLLAITASLVWAQGGSQNPRPRYDPKAEVTVAGTIEEVQLLPGHHRGTGTHLMVKTKSGTMKVHVGPTAYLEKQQFSFAKGDEIEVVGSQVKIAGTDALLARQVTKAGKTLSLRDQNGIPLWSRRARSGR